MNRSRIGIISASVIVLAVATVLVAMRPHGTEATGQRVNAQSYVADTTGRHVTASLTLGRNDRVVKTSVDESDSQVTLTILSERPSGIRIDRGVTATIRFDLRAPLGTRSVVNTDGSPVVPQDSGPVTG